MTEAKNPAPATAPAGSNPGGALPEEPKKRTPLPAGWFGRLVLALTGTVWLGLGATAFANPEMLADLVDFQLESKLARYEFRAMYGGLSVALAVLHYFGALRTKWLAPALAMAMALLIGLSAGRIVSLAEGFPGVTGLTLLFSEIVMIGLIGFAMIRLGLHRKKP